MNRFRNIVLAAISTSVAVTLVSCGQDTANIQGADSPSNSNQQTHLDDEATWAKGHGELPSKIGDGLTDTLAVDATFTDLFDIKEEVWQQTEYDLPTGVWFSQEENSPIRGYGLTSGTQQAGSKLEIIFFGHTMDGEPVERDVRVQLTERDGIAKSALIDEDIIYVDKVKSSGTEIYENMLPEKENAAYLLSVEILNANGEVEDTKLSYIYVPIPEANATLAFTESIYSASDSSATLVLHNEGPVPLSLGVDYTIEKQVGQEWRTVPLEMAFIEIGVELPIGGEHRDDIEIGGLSPGKYRAVKEVWAHGIDASFTLAAEFEIK
jgi:hypothetical protein